MWNINIRILFLFVGFVTIALASRQDILNSIRKHIHECQKEINVSDDFVAEIGSKTESDPKKAGEFAWCVNIKTGIQTLTGEFADDKIKETFKNLEIDESTVKIILSKCKLKTSSGGGEAALFYFQCLNDVVD
ncbi:uncharacterized protein LOC114348149 [Diabrotica virgifera virgifera]|uniref:Uncharacterized protein LOC114348149 n=1 Tax=Diabrotica virgifera virgifera TaxID=50390 RepID=A0A6P7H7M5_DIAVI|nr:uncharacterized protein LOC114348149 [Diabrotica virgifera virgifera]